jgi:CubicO group peptidase (beta-lactamase class C family)
MSEEYGIDFSILNEMFDAILKINMGIDSIHIIKNETLVYEKFFEYYDYSNLHSLHYATKGITVTLVGIANASGYITDLDQPILEIFADRTIKNNDSRKQAITIRHLLKMQTGLLWREDANYHPINKTDYEFLTDKTSLIYENLVSDPEVDTIRITKNPDWIQYILDKPVVYTPGTQVDHSSAASFLLSAIIQKKTGMKTEEFAQKYLFKLLNITNYYWRADPQGINIGGYGLWLHPIDMVKIGQLYLNKGTWNRTLVVPKEWILESTQLSSYECGYHWMRRQDWGGYYVRGYGGQIIFIRPDLNLVVVITSSEYHNFASTTLLKRYILPAANYEPSPSNYSVSFLFPFLWMLGVVLLVKSSRKRKL